MALLDRNGYGPPAHNVAALDSLYAMLLLPLTLPYPRPFSILIGRGRWRGAVAAPKEAQKSRETNREANGSGGLAQGPVVAAYCHRGIEKRSQARATANLGGTKMSSRLQFFKQLSRELTGTQRS
jgi:hypothetical protein